MRPSLLVTDPDISMQSRIGVATEGCHTLHYFQIGSKMGQIIGNIFYKFAASNALFTAMYTT